MSSSNVAQFPFIIFVQNASRQIINFSVIIVLSNERGNEYND